MKHPARCLFALLLVICAASPALAQQDLLTREEVESVLGVTVEVEPRGNEGNSFTSRDPLGSVTLDIMPASASRMLKGANETIPDLGDDAFFQLAMGKTVVLHVIDGEQGLMLSVSFPMQLPEGLTDLKAVALELARLAVEES